MERSRIRIRPSVERIEDRSLLSGGGVLQHAVNPLDQLSPTPILATQPLALPPPTLLRVLHGNETFRLNSDTGSPPQPTTELPYILIQVNTPSAGANNVAYVAVVNRTNPVHTFNKYTHFGVGLNGAALEGFLMGDTKWKPKQVFVFYGFTSMTSSQFTFNLNGTSGNPQTVDGGGVLTPPFMPDLTTKLINQVKMGFGQRYKLVIP